ncbi:MAG: Ig-like domain-containing protein [Paracoccaceae bacterium]
MVATDVAGNATSRNLRPTLDTVAPTIDSLLVQGGPAFEDVTTIGFRIVFSEEVLGFGAADLTLVEGLDVAFGTGQDGAPNAFEISVFGDGFVPYDGPVTPALAPATDVTDAAGNLITDFTPATLAPASLNTLAPVYLGSTRAVPAGETTDADTITFRLRFSEAVTGLDAADIAVTTTPEPGFPGIAPSDLAVSVLADPVAPPPGEFTALVQLTGPGIAEFNGTVSVDLLATNDAVDGLGQTTELDPARVNQAFILDNVLPPGASGDAFAVAEDGTLVGLNILGNDAADDATIVSVDTSLTTGTVVFDPAGQTVDYTASGFDALPAGATANDTFTYAISNVRGTSTATVSITVTGVNDAPVAADDAATTGEDSAVTIPVLANDTDADTPAEALSIAMVEMPDNGGTVSIDGQSLEFDPMGAFDDLRTGETRLTSFAYMVADGLGGMDVGLVQVTVTGVNDAPVAVDDRATTFAETSVEILPLSNDTDPDALPGELTIAAIGVPDNGGTAELDGATVTFDPNGEFAALAAGATAESRFPVNVVDGEGATSVSEIVVTVTGVNNGPVAADDAATTDEDTPVAIAPLANDTDIDGSPAGLSVASLSQPDNGGSVSLANGIVTFQPGDAFDDLAAGESRETRSGYTVTDGQGGTDTGEIVVTVTGVNDAPVAADDAAMASESGSVQISPLVNATDIDTPAAALTASLLGQPDNGGAASLANGVVTFAADGDFEDLALGETRLTRVAYGVSDGEGGTDTGEIVVTVTGENDAPVAVDDLAGTDEATGLALFPLLNDTDVDAAPGELAILSFTQPTAGGSVVRAGNGLFFDPAGAFDGLAPGESGSAVFSYSVVDGEGATDTAEITVTVSGVNDAPVAADDVATTDEDTSVSVPVLANDNDAEGNDGLTIVGVSVPDAGGTATIQGGAILFNPVGDFEDLSDGEARVSGFTYTLRDADGAEAIARAEVTVEGVNDLPVPGPDTATLAEGARIAVPVLANDSDAEDPRALLSIASVGPVEGGGTATLEGREIRYDTAGAFESLGVDETATVSVPFVVADTDGGTAPGLLTITVTGENDAPEPADDGFMISEDAAATLDVFFNDTDPDGDPLVLASVGGPEGGAATRADGDLAVFDPNGAFDRLAPGETAESRFIYTVADPSGAEGAAFVTVTIEGVNDAPVAEDDVSVAASEGTSLVPVLGNDSDVDGPASGLRVTAVGPVTGGGTASASGTGVTYDPGTAFLGLNGTAVVSFAYTVADAFGATDTATVTLTIDGENAPPVALDDTAETTPATPVSVDVLVNDSDAEGPVNLIEIVETRGAGAFSIDGESVEFDPTGAFDDLLGNQVAVAEADYRIADADGTTAVATVTVTIAGENRAPVATDDTATTGEDAALTVQVLDNDSDAEDPTAALALASVGTATGGGTATAVGRAIEFDPTGAFDTLNVGQTATVEVPYTVADTAGATDTGTLTVTITGVNDAPVAAADTGATDPDTAITLDVLANDTDVDDAAAGFTLVSVGIPNAGGSATLVDGQIAFDPGTAFLDLGAGETRQTSFSYVMADPGGLESGAEVVVTVTGGAPVNRPPVAGDDTASTLQGVPVVVDVLATDIDPDPGDTLSVVSIDEVRRDGVPTALAVTLVEGGIRVAAGAAFVALAAGQTSVVEVDHTIADALGATDQATAAVTVIGVNDVPVAVDDTGEVAAGATVQVDVLANDSDPDAGDEISLASIEGVRRDGTPAELDVEIVGGEIQLAATEAFAALGSGQTATVEVDYAITDSLGAAATATAVITVRGGNQPPNAVADAGATTAGVPVAIDVLANDTDADSDPNGFEILSVGTPDAGGTATLVNGEVLFNPAGAFADLGIGESRQTVFTYLLADGDGATDTATVTVTVTGAAGGENLPPIALDDSGTLAAGEALTLPVTLNDLDPEGGEISLLGIEGVRRDGEVADLAVAPVGDGIRLSAGTAFRSLGEGATSVVAVDYTIADPEGLTAPGLARFTVVGVNDAPVARDDTGNAVAGLAAPLYAVLANDSDVDMGDVLTLAAVTGQRVNGLAIDVGAEIDGAALSFDATAPAFADLAPGETATLEIDYAVSDLAGAPDTATLTVTVEGGPDEGQNLAPIVEDDAGTTTAGTPLVIDVLASDIDPEGAPLTLASIDAVRRDGVPSEVAVTIVADGLRLAAGNAFVALAAGETSTVEADHTVTDPEGAAATATARFTVEGVNDAPIARDDEAAAEEGATLTVDVLANDRDPDDGDTLSLATVGEIRFAGQPVQVPATATEDGIEIATAGLPDVTVGETAVLEIDYTIADAAGATDGATLFVTLTGGSEGPIAGDDSLFIERSVGEGTIPLFENDTGGAGGAVTLFDFETGPITLLTFDEAGTVIAEEALPLALVDIAIGPDGVASYRLLAGYPLLATRQAGVQTVTYTVRNEAGETATAEAFFSVDGPGFDQDFLNEGTTIGGRDGNDGGDFIGSPDGIDDSVQGGRGDDLMGGGPGNDTLAGGAGDDQIFGEDGDDVLSGDEGDDTLAGGAGDDEISGGTGNDNVSGGAGDDEISGGTGNDNVSGGAGNDEISGGTGNDTLSGGCQYDKITGGDGDDEISGGDGDDLLEGGPGDDTIDGGADDDAIRGGEGDDSLAGEAGDDLIEGQEGDDTLQGGDGNDTLVGGPGSDSLDGGGGNDDIYGGDGHDTLDGGAGNDTIIGEGGNDKLDGGGGDDLLIGDDGNDVLEGGDGNDTIVGEGGNDGLIGGAGDDVLISGPGIDGLIGGNGADRFVFAPGDGSGNQIADFAPEEDTLVLDGFAGLTAQGVIDGLTLGARGLVFSAEGTEVSLDGLVDPSLIPLSAIEIL